MRKTLPFATATAILATACLGHPLVAPSPVTFHSSRSARDATRSAAIALVDAGFRVVQADSIGFALKANRTATHNGNAEFVTCALPSGSAAAVNRETTLNMAFRAAPAEQGSDITVSSSVNTTYPGEGTATQIPPSDTICVSNGTMERRLQVALR